MTLTKRAASLAVIGPALLLLLTSTGTWARATSEDVLGQDVVQVSGGTAAPGITGLAAVCVVALLALMTGGRIIRAIGAVVLVLAALGAFAFAGVVVVRPGAAVASEVAKELGRTSAAVSGGSTTVWAVVGTLAALLVVVGSVFAARSSRTWGGLSSRYERVPADGRGPRGEVRTAWDELTDGHDPTLRDGPGQT